MMLSPRAHGFHPDKLDLGDIWKNERDAAKERNYIHDHWWYYDFKLGYVMFDAK